MNPKELSDRDRIAILEAAVLNMQLQIRNLATKLEMTDLDVDTERKERKAGDLRVLQEIKRDTDWEAHCASAAEGVQGR